MSEKPRLPGDDPEAALPLTPREKAGGDENEPDAPRITHDQVEAQNLIDLYVLGQLPTALARRFEQHFMTCPECLEKLELSETLIVGLREGARQDLQALHVGLGASLLNHRKTLGLLLILLLLPSLWLLHQLDVTNERLEDARSSFAIFQEPQGGAIFLPMSPSRDAVGTTPSHVVHLPSEMGWLVLSLELELGSESTYQVELLDAEDASLWRSDPLSPNAFDALVVTIPSSYLANGDYSLAVSPAGAPSAGSGLRFSFRAISAPD